MIDTKNIEPIQKFGWGYFNGFADADLLGKKVNLYSEQNSKVGYEKGYNDFITTGIMNVEEAWFNFSVKGA